MSYQFRNSAVDMGSSPRTAAPNRYVQWLQKHWFRASLIVLMLIALAKRDWTMSWRTKPQPKIEQSAKNELPNGFTQTPPAAVAEGGKTEDIPLNIGSAAAPLPLQRNDASKATDFAAMPQTEVKAYIQRFAKVAIQERQKFGIPASVIVAAGLKASFAGKRDVTLSSYNHFALLASADWRGATEGIGGVKYRRYDNAWQSFRDHSLYLTSGKYAAIKQKLKPTEYKSWAKALQDAGYPEGGKQLAAELIRIIDRYELYRLDTAK